MESVQAAAWSNRADRGIIQQLDRQADADARDRSARAYRGTARTSQAIPVVPTSTAPVSLELSNVGHRVDAYADFDDSMTDEGVHVRLIDPVTTRTLGELTVGSTLQHQARIDDYRQLQVRWSTTLSGR
ncbi:MAG: hypothetical protein ACKVVP_02975 [Chloroflexota bacterium]